MSTRNLVFTLAYAGAGFCGWQSQPGMRAVQSEVESVLRRILGHPLSLQGASRTDAGVHALRQVANVSTGSHIPISNLLRAIDHRLPEDITLIDLRPAPPEFHATRSARGKLYRYRLWNAQRRPVAAGVSASTWHVWVPLDFDRLIAAARAFVGTHDFAGFQTKGSPRATTIRTIFGVSIRRRLEEIQIDIRGDGFLYQQVRNMVGTLFEIARGHWPPERVAEILHTGDRRLAGPAAPAHGLTLQWVDYGSIGGLPA